MPRANGSCSHPGEQGAGGYVKTKVGSRQFADAVQRLFLIDIGGPIYVQFPQMRSSMCDCGSSAVLERIARRLNVVALCDQSRLVRAAFELRRLKMHAKYR